MHPGAVALHDVLTGTSGVNGSAILHVSLRLLPGRSPELAIASHPEEAPPCLCVKCRADLPARRPGYVLPVVLPGVRARGERWRESWEDLTSISSAFVRCRRTNMRPGSPFVKRVNTIYCASILGQSQYGVICYR